VTGFHEDRESLTSGGDGQGLGGIHDDQPGIGWWVGSDGAWHGPDENFDDDVPRRKHPLRRVAVVILAVALVGATTVGAWLGFASTSPGSTGGPSPSALDAEVEQILSGTGPNQFGISGVRDVVCAPVVTWSPGSTFECSVYAAQQRKIGVYRGVVAASTSAGGWSWTGTWYPVLRPGDADQQL
jgi:hypothetical protein